MAKSLEEITINRYFKIGNNREVITFLTQHPFLLPILDEAYTKILQAFPNADQYLDLSVDPEIADSERLVLAVSPKLPPEQAFSDFKRFKQDWWLSASKQTQNKLYIMLEYR